MAKKGILVVRSGDNSHSMSLSSRDVHLLDGEYFFQNGWAYRKLFGLDFVRGLKSPPPTGVPLVSHNRLSMLRQVQGLLVQLETQRDLIAFDYSYGFEDEGGRKHGGGVSGFRVEGGVGAIDVRPAGYCDLTISDVGPNGRGRVVAMINLRVRREFQTLLKGKLTSYRRKAVVGWFDELPSLIDFLSRAQAEMVDVVHAA